MNIASCEVCRKQFSYRPSQQVGRFCSIKCRGILQNKQRVESGLASAKSARCYMLRYREYCCSVCKNSEWMGKSLTLQVDHVDGNVNNSLPENLRWLCPNCHSQTPNWGAKNIKQDNKHRLRTRTSELRRMRKVS